MKIYELQITKMIAAIGTDTFSMRVIIMMVTKFFAAYLNLILY